MNGNTVNREERRSHVLSVRLTDREHRLVMKSLKDFATTDGSCFSDKLRQLLVYACYKSRRYSKTLPG